MTTTLDPAEPASKKRGRPTPTGLFRAFWRWHFYASFLVLPIFAMLAATGLIYLFRFQIEPMMHADVMRVERPVGQTNQTSLAFQLAKVEEKYPTAQVSLIREVGTTTTPTPSRSPEPTVPRPTSSSTPGTPRCSGRSTPTRRCPATPSGCTAT